jgi:signal transduction histidine kinase
MAHNAKDAFKILKKENISLLILDMELPDMHGLELMDKIRSLGLIADLQILAISGSANPSIVRQALKGGASDFLRKPFMYEEFMLKIDSRIEASIDRMTIKKQKQQIEDNLKSFEVLVNATIDAMFIFENHICTDVNLEALKLLGCKKKEQLRGKNIKEIFKDIIVENQNALLDDTTDYDFEDIMISKDQKQYNVQIKEKNVKMSNKNLKIIAVMDITKIKQNEKILSHQAKMASMGEMIGNIAHQWRQPLTAISVAAGGIKLNYEFDIATKEETLKELDNIVENTQFLSSTIESFQNFLKEDKIVENFSIEPTVKKTLAIISANLVSNNITIIKNYKQQIKVNGIQNELVQVFLNIINNATDILKTFKDKDIEKYIIIDVDKLDDERGIISIQDSAGGIPDDIINKIFEPYFTTKHQSQGTGLGLYMTHQIVTKMGGTITVANQKFKYNNKEFVGAKFDIVLNLSK